uniref:Uncharacterized protein n=1 Tax=Anguilla anguilla TaxID=7936 RepID=A0A0E9PYE5_ANGAN
MGTATGLSRCDLVRWCSQGSVLC